MQAQQAIINIISATTPLAIAAYSARRYCGTQCCRCAEPCDAKHGASRHDIWHHNTTTGFLYLGRQQCIFGVTLSPAPIIYSGLLSANGQATLTYTQSPLLFGTISQVSVFRRLLPNISNPICHKCNILYILQSVQHNWYHRHGVVKWGRTSGWFPVE